LNELINTLFAELSAIKETFQAPHTLVPKVLKIPASLQAAKSGEESTEFMG